MACGAAEGLIAFGLEALDILRPQRAILHVGTDIDSAPGQPISGGVSRKAAGLSRQMRLLLHPAAAA